MSWWGSPGHGALPPSAPVTAGWSSGRHGGSGWLVQRSYKSISKNASFALEGSSHQLSRVPLLLCLQVLLVGQAREGTCNHRYPLPAACGIRIKDALQSAPGPLRGFSSALIPLWCSRGSSGGWGLPCQERRESTGRGLLRPAATSPAPVWSTAEHCVPRAVLASARQGGPFCLVLQGSVCSSAGLLLRMLTKA